MVNNPGLNAIKDYPVFPLGNWPTPIRQIDLDGHSIQVKHDDESGFCRGGAKTRKLETLIHHLQAKSYTDLIVLVGNITNLGFDLVKAFETLDLEHHIYVIDDPVATLDDRKTFFKGIFNDIHLLGKSRTLAFHHCMRKYLSLRIKGRNPFLLLPGASHPCSVIGNAKGLIEYVEQCEKENLDICSHLYISLATGTSSAGFLLAAAFLRQAGYQPITTVGVNIYSAYGLKRLRSLMRWTCRFLNINIPNYNDLIDIDKSHLAGGFASYKQRHIDIYERIKQDYEFEIDPVFGAKTWAFMEDQLNRFPEQKALFWHCGYTPEWQCLGPGLTHS